MNKRTLRTLVRENIRKYTLNDWHNPMAEDILIQLYMYTLTREDRLGIVRQAIGLLTYPVYRMSGMCTSLRSALGSDAGLDVYHIKATSCLRYFNPHNMRASVEIDDDPVFIYWWPIEDQWSRRKAFIRLERWYRKHDDPDNSHLLIEAARYTKYNENPGISPQIWNFLVKYYKRNKKRIK